MCIDTDTLELYRRIAKVCHEVNRAYCEALGDMSQVPWELAPDWQQASALNGVRYHLEHRDSAPADSHNSWLVEKTRTGWVLGTVKNPDAAPPTHPCMVPFEQLPAEQRAKDFLFLAVVRQLAVLL
jgi:hypothetical protein